MVCPLILLTDKTSAYTGLYPCAYPKPDWWSVAPVASPEIEEPKVTITVPQKVGPPTLFDMTPEEEPAAKPAKEQRITAEGAEWITALLKSQVYKHQKAMIRRHPVEDHMMEACLSALDASGGIMTPTGFAKAADVPMARLDGLVVKMQRVLNVDGYEILTLDRKENRVELNVAKLKRQFDLD
jgi:hypothetical protein